MAKKSAWDLVDMSAECFATVWWTNIALDCAAVVPVLLFFVSKSALLLATMKSVNSAYWIYSASAVVYWACITAINQQCLMWRLFKQSAHKSHMNVMISHYLYFRFHNRIEWTANVRRTSTVSVLILATSAVSLLLVGIYGFFCALASFATQMFIQDLEAHHH